ncbi:hypothetical protein ACOT1K_13805 [Providencia manganoxydans]
MIVIWKEGHNIVVLVFSNYSDTADKADVTYFTIVCHMSSGW